MTDHLTMLFKYIDEIESLDLFQDWIDHARNAAPANQHVQLELDRQQSDVDRKRTWIGMMMADIRNRN